MQVKVIIDGVSSDWTEFTRSLRVRLNSQPPDCIIVHIGDLFPGSPESSQTVKLDYELFTLLAHDFALEADRQRKQDKRHLASTPIDEVDSHLSSSLISTVEAEFERSELRRKIECAKNLLTPIQKRRFLMHFDEGFTYRRIAELEGGLHHKDIEESVSAALKKFKKLLK